MSATSFTIQGHLVNILERNIYPASVSVSNGKIASIQKLSSLPKNSAFILPGFIDSHVHIESSMLPPSEFARMAVTHGTIATVSDPHEIANVCGIEGIHFMIENGNTTPFHFFFGAPSCVPATNFETAGASLNSKTVSDLLQQNDIYYLSEMMNFPGVLMEDEEVMKKIKAAQLVHKPIDGHAPGLRGEQARKYALAGISTDHECSSYDEAKEKLSYGMKILIREGSAAKNFEALITLLPEHENDIMFCSDDKHPDSLAIDHINKLCARAVAKGIDVFQVLKAACVNPLKHYQLPTGLVQAGDDANFIVVEDLKNFRIKATYLNGKKVAEEGKSFLPFTFIEKPLNYFNCKEIHAEQLEIKAENYPMENGFMPVIEAIDGELITKKLMVKPLLKNGYLQIQEENDILKIVVINRYNPAKPAIAFIKNFGLKGYAAMASSVAHDSHNIIAVGTHNEALTQAINLVIKHCGGISCVKEKEEKILPLSIAGLMSTEEGYSVAKNYTAIDAMAKQAGTKLTVPYMTLSFMALLVIPALKLSDKGLFDGEKFCFL